MAQELSLGFETKYDNNFSDFIKYIKQEKLSISHYTKYVDEYTKKVGNKGEELRIFRMINKHYAGNMKRELDSYIRDIYNKNIDKYTAFFKEKSAEMFKKINSGDPNKEFYIGQIMGDMKKQKFMEGYDKEELKLFLQKGVDKVLVDIEKDLDQSMMESVKEEFVKYAMDEFDKTFADARDNFETHKDEMLVNGEKLVKDHVNEKDEEELTEQATEMEQKEAATSEYTQGLEDLEQHKDKEIFGLTTDELISKISNVMGIYGITLSKDENGKLHAYDINDKELIIEDNDSLVIKNNETEMVHDIGFIGDEKDKVSVKTGDQLVQYCISENKYTITPSTESNYEFTIDATNNLYYMTNRNSFDATPVSITLEELKTELAKCGMDPEKLEGISKTSGRS